MTSSPLFLDGQTLTLPDFVAAAPQIRSGHRGRAWCAACAGRQPVPG